MRTQFGLQNARRAGKDHVRGGGGHHNQVNIRRLHASGFQRALRGDQRQVAGFLFWRGNMAGADAGAADNPFVAGVQPLGNLGVGQHLFWQIAARACNAGINHGQASVAAAFNWPATCSVMCWMTSASASSRACSSAQRKPRLSVPPWLFTTMPRRPKRLAPL